MKNCEGCGGKQSRPILDFPIFIWRDLRKITDVSVRITGFWAEIWNRVFWNSKQER
jgi:hypothetical protein